MVKGNKEMKIKVCAFEKLVENIKNQNQSIVMFGAGAIGQIVVPELLNEYGILKNVDCYIDNDCTKWNTKIAVREKELEIKSPDYLKQCDSKTVILINISRYAEVKYQLELLECTSNMEAYIMPMMLIHNFCRKESSGNATLSNEPIIPKKINYMWLGKKEIPANLRKCIETWRELCPDYEIIEWNENNYDISKHPYMKLAYECEAYGFVPDYARLDILYNEGGFYFDTDVILKRNLDSLRNQEAFCGVEKWQIFNFGGGSGAVKGNPMIKKFLDARRNLYFIDNNGKQNKNTCGYYDTQVALREGYIINGKTQTVNGMNMYAYDYFHPYDYMSGTLCETQNTVSIHQFNGGWLDEKMKEQNRIAAVQYSEVYNECIANN